MALSFTWWQNIQHTEWEKHMVMISTVKGPQLDPWVTPSGNVSIMDSTWPSNAQIPNNLACFCLGASQCLYPEGQNQQKHSHINQASKQSFAKIWTQKKKGEGSSKQRNPRKFQTDQQNKNWKQKTKSRKTKRFTYLGISTLGEAKLVNKSIHLVHFLFERRAASKA